MTFPWPISQDLYTSPSSSVQITLVKEVKQSCSVFHYRTQANQIISEKREIMFHLNSKSNKRCNRQGSTISFPKVSRPLMGTLFTSRVGSLCLTPLFAPPSVIHMSLGAINITSPASHLFPEASFILLF